MNSDEEQTLILGVNANRSQKENKPQAPEELIFKRPSNPSILPKVTGVNVLADSVSMDINMIRNRLRNMGIEIKWTMYSRFPEGNRLLFLYCITMQGQYVLVELPTGTPIDFGDI